MLSFYVGPSFRAVRFAAKQDPVYPEGSEPEDGVHRVRTRGESNEANGDAGSISRDAAGSSGGRTTRPKSSGYSS